MRGSEFSTTGMGPSAGFEVTAGEPVIGGLHGERARHHHCDWCKSWLFTRIEPDMGFVNVRAGALDDPTWFAPFVESYTSEMRSEEHTSELQSLMRISYAVFCLKKKKQTQTTRHK